MSKQEKIVCAAVKKWLGDEGSVELFVDYPPKYLTGDAQIGYAGYQKGFITNKNRFVDPVEAMKVSANNDNRVDKGIYKEIGRLRKELAKAYSKRNGGQIGAEVGLNILQTKYSELEESLNEFRRRNYLLPEDLY